jgi:hypothetical protein
LHSTLQRSRKAPIEEKEKKEFVIETSILQFGIASMYACTTSFISGKIGEGVSDRSP